MMMVTPDAATVVNDSHSAMTSLASTIAVAFPTIAALPSSIAPSVIRAAELGAFPAIGMNVVTLAGLKVATPATVVGALQHFSAGILLTTVAKELLPEMVQATGLAENLASGVGFFAGVALLIWLGEVFPDDDDDDDEAARTMAEKEPEHAPSTSLRNRRLSLKTRAYQFEEESSSAWWEAVEEADDTSSSNIAIAEEAVATLPTALLAAVAIDSALDGLLIGISTAVDPNTGPLLSASLTVESSFLGLTLAAALRNRPLGTVLLAATAAAPAAIFSGSIVGGSLAPYMAQNTCLLTACLGFGTSTALFMVAEELLLQAHEDGSEHVWWVDFQLYTGFFASVMIEKFFGM